MQNRSVLIILLAVFGLIFAILLFVMFSDVGDSQNKTPSNWQWGDDWNAPGEIISEVNPVENIKKPEVRPEEPPPETLVVARDYPEALKFSGKLGRPILAYFETDWCHFCREMKNETLSDGQVKLILKHYVFVYVNADQEKGLCKQFGVSPVPAYVITNVDQTKLKFGVGKKSPKEFVQWLNDPNLFKQPKKEVRVEVVVLR